MSNQLYSSITRNVNSSSLTKHCSFCLNFHAKKFFWDTQYKAFAFKKVRAFIGQLFLSAHSTNLVCKFVALQPSHNEKNKAGQFRSASKLCERNMRSLMLLFENWLKVLLYFLLAACAWVLTILKRGRKKHVLTA